MRLIKLLPDYYENNETMVLLQEILSQFTDRLDHELITVIQNCFISTASALLSRYERIYGLVIDTEQTDMFRRERIIAKLAGVGTSTKTMIEQTAASYSNGEIEITEDNEHYTFTVRFVGEHGIPANMKSLKLTMEEIKPAHLAVEYVYTYNTWEDIAYAKKTWSQMETYTWDRIRTVNL